VKKIYEVRDRVRTTGGNVGVVVNNTTVILIEKSTTQPSGFISCFLDINEKSQCNNANIELMSEKDIRELEETEPQLVFTLDMIAQATLEFSRNI